MVKPAMIGKSPSTTSEERMRVDTDLKYKGVRKRKWGKWVSEVRLPNSRERIWLGSYDSAEKAARAFDAAQVCLRGASARLNFPGTSPPEVPSGPLTHHDIQMIAARFADSALPPEFSLGPTVSDESSEAPQPGPSDSGRTSPDSPSNSMSVGWPGNVDSTGGGAVLDFLVESGPEEYKPLDYGIFPGFDDFMDDYYSPMTTPMTELGEEKFEDFSGQEISLWNY